MNRHSKSLLDQINVIIVIGLLVITAILWIGIFVVFAITGKTDSSMILAASSTSSGLIGFLSREFKMVTGDDNSATVTDQSNSTENNKK